ncbi:hypothetical protein [Streptomyces sp. NBC_00690]|uniref:hypothetical protein n=1 Tax=Streptomyces sp. NBC_00690 TaxID=2975808 RepID=UPI002E2BB3FC|nr:hypothetical protein [Streptomyces sp. NBC_00690]
MLTADGLQSWIPVLDGSERLGVLHLVQDAAPQPPSEASVLAGMGQALASMAGLLLVSKRTNSDSYACLARARPMSVSAEMQWALMPPMTFANDRVVVSAAMEPAYQIAGDPSTTPSRATPRTWRSSMPWGTTPPPG